MNPPPGGSLLAHGSGWDEIVIFISVPLLYFGVTALRRAWARAHGRPWPPGSDDPAEQDRARGEGPATRD